MALGQIRRHEGNKAALIGEEQARVDDIASKKGYLTIKYSGNYIFETNANGDLSPHHEMLSIAYNTGWITGLMSRNYKIHDIGLSQNYRDRNIPVSKWYRAEITTIRFRRYEHYRKMPQTNTAGYL